MMGTRGATWFGAGWLMTLVAAAAVGEEPLRFEGWSATGQPRWGQANGSQVVARLESSDDLVRWTEVARLHGAFHGFPDLRPAGEQRFYRTQLAWRTEADDWKNHAVYPADPLLSPDPGWGRYEPRWVKFALVLEEPHRVYFQDSTKYPFHYDFAVQRLERFRGMTRAEFDAVSLRRAGQQVVLGAVLYAPTEALSEIGIQLVGLEAYPREKVAEWWERVRAVLELRQAATFYYFPTFEQQAVAEANREYLAARGIEVASAARWVTADEVYASGWALGRLVGVPAAEIRAAYAAGRLRPQDVLWTEALPAEVPPVAGIITLAPATPNSHVALLAQSWGIPLVYFSAPEMREQVRQWEGQEVVLRASVAFGASAVKIVSVEGQLTEALRAEILALRAPPRLDLAPKAFRGALSLTAEGLRPEDVRHVGGKAANFGLLRRSLPTNSPSPAVAFTFDLWDGYLDQRWPGGGTLREAVDAELAGSAWPPDLAVLPGKLARVRDWMTDVADFSEEQRQAILAALVAAGFEPGRKIRFRSSTNVEDSEHFSGAGLYDSFSGCLADDLDGDEAGPSACDPAEPRERGVLRALRKVYASFYNDNAYLERLRHGVEEAEVGMGVLAHYSAPDEIEWANGVATAAIRRGAAPRDRWVDWRLVTQVGAVPVTRPEPNAWPEDMEGVHWGAGEPDPWLTLRRSSSLVPLGGTVLGWRDEYVALVRMLDRAARAYEAEFPGKASLTLDFEYKKLAPAGGLEVKQIREVPQPRGEGTRVPWLLNETNRWAVFQGEYGDVFANHRLKSAWSLGTTNVRLTPAAADQTFYRQVTVDLIEGAERTTRGGELSAFPGFRHGRDGASTLDEWRWGSGTEERQFLLRTTLPGQVPADQCPLLFLPDGWVELQVRYAVPQLTLDWNGPTNTQVDSVILRPREAVSARSLWQQRRLEGKGLVIETTFYWPPNPAGPVAGYTAPVQAWVETRVTGLVAAPLVLRGEFSQSYRPGHHNFVEDFLFDPHLEEGMDAGVRAELVARNIRGVVGQVSFGETLGLWLWGWDDRLRPYPGP